MSGSDSDGRFFAQYAQDHCVCAYCWGPLVQIYDEETHQWVALCAANSAHVGYHHQAFKDAEINKHTTTYMEVREFYRQTVFAPEFGLTPRLTGQPLIDHAKAMKRQLGRVDDRLYE